MKKQRKRGRRRKNAAKNKKFKRLKKAEIIKSKIKELNNNFAKIKEQKNGTIKKERFSCKHNICFYHLLNVVNLN